ncbi:tyrosine-type recombinase/integrase [Serratia liquefaciens]|uniref:Site-specific integrase n=1 Tax=Serratia liquefaciens TaxID=614 RepID=A0A515CTB3_SERLI|nr:site-specific integrase [Serratia liquefaciens]QDL31330.1 site-specific integrase [Serratia liquefaciens]
MAYFSIEKRLKSDGTPRYRCTVGVKENGKYIYRENRTFGKQSHAKTWGVSRVAELEKHGIPNSNDAEKLLIKDLIQRYIDDPATGGRAGSSKLHVLNRLLKEEVSAIPLTDLRPNHIIDHCRFRTAAGAAPSTVAHDLSYLSTVLSAAKPIYGIEYTDNPIILARPLLRNMGLIGKSNRRSRRTAGEEVALLTEALEERAKHPRSVIPFVDIFNFSILTCMRIGEVCRLRWEDINEEQRSVLVRDRKDPRKKAGNHMIVALLGDSWEIAMRQPKKSALIFPYKSRSVSAGFTRVCESLNIEDLHYHDLRREGASRLFEAGFSIEEVAQVTGHKSLKLLWQVYTELYPKSLHEKFEQLQKSRLTAK